MNGRQHDKVGIGAGIGTAICLLSMEPYGLEPTIGAVLGGITARLAAKLPDIDHNSTKIGRTRKKITGTSNTLVNLSLIAVIVISIVLIVTGKTQIMGFDLSTELLLKVSGISLAVIIVKNAINKNSTVKWMKSHRGFMHTLILPIVFGVCAWIIPSLILQRILIGLTVGYVCHLDADMYTVDGNPLLFPITRHSFRRPNAKKSEDPKLDRIARSLSIRYIVIGIILAVILKL